MGSGIAKSIKEKWPIVYNNYMEMYNILNGVSGALLGDILTVNLWDDSCTTDSHQSVINMFSQEHYGYDGRRYTSYDAFWNCLCLIKKTVPKGSKIGFPDHIGCSLGGANWEVVRTMIEQVLGEDYEVYIYKLKV